MKQPFLLTVLFILFIGLLGFGYAWVTKVPSKDRTSSTTSTNASMLATGGELRVSGERVAYGSNSFGYFARPETEGVYPGVVMIHEWWGLNDHIREMARTLAGEGYQVLAVDLYGGRVAATTSEAMELRNSVTKEETTVNLRDAVRFLREKEATKIASFGWCYGGGKSLELALSGEKLDATIIYYGTLSTSTSELARINWPVLGIFGDKDRSISVETVNEFDRALDGLGITNDIHVYPGVGHAFANPSGANFAPNETKDAWAKTLEFLGTNLR
jgi:carboxymethylenebutenolidase